MDNIRDHVRKAIVGGLAAQMTQRDGQSGVLFHDESEFIPFSDLNYNNKYGYFRISQFPEIQRDCENDNPERIHRGSDFHEWVPFIWSDSGGDLTLLGDDYQLADLYQALGDYLLHGKLDDEEISEDDPMWSYMRRIDWAVNEYRTVLSDDIRTDDKIANTIRAAAAAGRIHGAKLGESGNWYFNPPRFRGWLVKTRDEKRGRPRKTETGNAISNLIEHFDGNVSGLQHQLATMARQATGKIPRGQLWQPCEEPGCNNEPVCMNCMKCQEIHCHCFD